MSLSRPTVINRLRWEQSTRTEDQNIINKLQLFDVLSSFLTSTFYIDSINMSLSTWLI